MLPETHPALRAQCRGEHTLSAKVDDETVRWLDRTAEQAKVSRSEVVRRFLDYCRAHERAIKDEAEL